MAGGKKRIEMVGAVEFNAAAWLEGAAFGEDDKVVAAVATGAEQAQLLEFDASTGALAGATEIADDDRYVLRSPYGWVTWSAGIRSTSDDGDVQWKRALTGLGSAAASGGDLLAFASGKACVVLHAKTGRTGCTIELPHDVLSVALSENGARVAIGVQKGLIQVHGTKDGELIASRKTTATLALAFSSDGGRLASGHGQGQVRMWDAETLKPVKGFGAAAHEFVEYGGPAGCRWMSFGSKGKTLLSLGNEHLVREWDAETGAELRRFEVPKRHRQGSVCALSGDQQRVVTGSTAGALSVWQLATGDRSGVDALLDEVELIAVNDDAVLVATRLGVQRHQAGGPPQFSGLDFGGPDFEQKISPSDRAQFHISGGVVDVPCVSADGACVAMPSGESVMVWTTSDSALFATLPCEGDARACCFDPLGKWLVAVDRTGIHVWSTDKAAQRLKSFELEWGGFHVHGIALSPKGRMLALSVDKYQNHSYPDSAVMIVDLSTGKSTTLELSERLRFGGMASDGGYGFFVADSLGRLHHIDASEPTAVFDEVVDPKPALVPPRPHPARPICRTADGRLGHLALDGNMYFHSTGERTDEAGDPPEFNAPPPEPTGAFETRLAGVRFFYGGKFEKTKKPFREEVAKQLGATLTKTANAKVTHLVVAKPTYGKHKPSAGEKKLRELIDGGAPIRVLNEAELVAMLLPTRAEAIAMLGGRVPDGLERWNRWMTLYREGAPHTPLALGALDLSGASLQKALLKHVDLAGTNLRGADLAGVLLERANLRGADLRDCNLTDVSAYAADIAGADLTGATIAGRFNVLSDDKTKWPAGYDRKKPR
jgi:WD40 repeat protein